MESSPTTRTSRSSSHPRWLLETELLLMVILMLMEDRMVLKLTQGFAFESDTDTEVIAKLVKHIHR